MTRTVRRTTVDDAGLAELLEPRDDLVRERADGDGRYTLDHGPFDQYERAVEVASAGGMHDVVETISFKLARGSWPVPFGMFYRRGLQRRHRSLPWWAPPDRPDAEAASVLGLLCTMSVVGGYLGTLITQTITFAADEFGAGERAEGTALAAVRFGILIALVMTALADRRGRRQIIVACAGVSIVATAISAFAPNLVALGAAQTVSRSMTTALAILIAVVAAEEMPAGSRAYAVSLLTMAGALGAGMCLWILPLADLGERWWRVLYVVPLLAIPVVRYIGRHLPESRRYRTPHVEAAIAGHGRRFWMLAAAAFLLAVFTTPASLFQNDYLRDERGFSAARLSLFVIATNTPAAIGIVIGGRIADVRGRRAIGAFGVVTGTLLTVWMFLVGGWLMWVASLAGAILGATVVPALGVYGPELFPTSLRGRANGVLVLVGVLGSVLGLVVVGHLSESFDEFGPALAIVSVGPLLMAALVLLAFPETAHRELEELNPEDAPAGIGSQPVPRQ